MNRHTIRVLEFEQIRSAVRERCLTEEASLKLRNERISTDHGSISTLHTLVASVRACMETTVAMPALSFLPVSECLDQVSRDGSVLEAQELAAIGTFCSSSTRIAAYLVQAAAEAAERGQPAAELASRVPDTSEISTRLGKFIDPDGSIREREIPQLKTIRDRINRAQQDLQRTAQSLLRREEMQRYWNASVPTQRDGRIVLPVRADHKGKIRGIVHEVSSTGATVFIEPDELVARNNECAEADSAYRAELLRILRELSTFCRQRHDVLMECLGRVVELDVIYARARYGLENDCCTPAISGNSLALTGARHPLLGDRAVPITLKMPEGKRVLIVTGPNTGGKTVALKTVGLLALMNQFGLQIPASPGSELPLFSGIFADIGDEQSIEQSLSTFSGHMRNIGRILSAADGESLVLLDELGSGTDPEEGGSLAMSILDELLELGPYTIVTTHHGQLKHYGFTQPAAANASVEFDSKSLRPTYHITPGVPGSSHAIDVAAHMGVLRRVTRRAKEYLSGDEYDTGHIIRKLTEHEQELHRERTEVKSMEHRLKSERGELDERAAKLDDRERELRDGRLRDLERWASEARSTLENLVRELREGEITRDKTQRVKQFITDLDEQLGRERAAATRHVAGVPSDDIVRNQDVDLEEGASVVVRSTGKAGTIHRKGKGRSWIVQIGTVRLPVDESDLELRTVKDVRPEVVAPLSSSAPARPVIDLRGERLEEALSTVERQIDAALLSGMRSFSIIHGTGEGVLQQGIRTLLQKHPQVQKFGYARPEEGGYGRTDVELT